MTATHIQLSEGILPTGTKINPQDPASAEYYDSAQVAYVVQVDGNPAAIRLITSFGKLGKDWALGTSHDMRHDQTRSKLGIGLVIGIVTFETGSVRGEAPARRIPHYVFK